MIVNNLDFLNANSLRAFPIHEGLIPISTDSVFRLPENFLVDCSISVSSDVNARYYISTLKNFTESIIIEVKQNLGGVESVVGTFNVFYDLHTRYKDYFMEPAEQFTNAFCRITVADVDTMASLPVGIFSFTIDSTEFETRCIVPSVGTINRFVFVDEKGDTHTLTGDVKILARNNLRFRSVDANTVVLDAGDGLGLNQVCEAAAPCIKYINSVSPDESGNFTLLGTDCARFTELSSPKGLLLSDTCCKPCLGCDEIDELTKRTMQVESDLYTLRQAVTDLNVLNAELNAVMGLSCEC